MERLRQTNDVAHIDSAKENRPQWPVSAKAFQQKKPIGSSETVFCRLRSNAISMNQKLSRAKQNILVKIADLKKQKEDNQVTRSRINEIKASIATLNAEISQREHSLEDFKQNSDAFHVMFGSAETVFQKNDARLEAVDRCVRKLKSYSSKLSVILDCADERVKILQSEITEGQTCLELSIASIYKVDKMLCEVKEFSSLVNGDLEELASALGVLTETGTILHRERQLEKNTAELHLFSTLTTSISKQRLTVLAGGIVALDGKLDFLQTTLQQLVDCHGNVSDLEQTYSRNCSNLGEMEMKLGSARVNFQDTKSFDFEVTESIRSILDQTNIASQCRSLLTACIDKQMMELALPGPESTEGIELNHRLKKMQIFKELRVSFLRSKVEKVEKRISIASTCVRDASTWLDKCNRLTEHLKPSINEVKTLQVQLASNLIITTELIEQNYLAQKNEHKKLTELLLYLSEKLHRVLHKKQLLSDLENNQKMAICVKDQLHNLTVLFQFLQRKKQHILSLCDNAMKKNAQLTSFIHNCERVNSALSKEIRGHDETATQEQLLYEKEARRLEQDYEKNNCELKTKKIIEQFDREFYRTNEFQERELNRKVKQLEAMLKNKRQQKVSGKAGQVKLRQCMPDGDIATSRLNGGRECPLPKPGCDFGLENDLLNELESMRKAKAIRKTNSHNRQRTSTSKGKKDQDNGTKKQVLAKSRQNTRDRSDARTVCKEKSFADVVVYNKNQIVSNTRHRRQAAKDNNDTVKLKSSSLELDPFAFS